jgi:cysteine synthase A
MKYAQDVSALCGKTPLVKINRLDGAANALVLAKLEFYNPTSSIKDRIAVAMVDAAEKSGALKPGGVIVEPTSGNTGLGLAMVAASRGYKLIITMPETMSVERRLLMEHFGAKIILTPGSEGMGGSVKKAQEIVAGTPGAFMPQQFENEANPLAHERGTALEIWDDTEGKVDAFVAGVGTGGTVSGVGKVLKARKPGVKILAVEPQSSAVLSGCHAGRHAIQGIGAGFVPKIFNREVVDEIVQVSDNDALETAKALSTREGILCGISSGANVFAALQAAKRPEFKDKVIVAIVCDTGERYLSTALFT